MREEFKPAIDALVADLRDQEHKVATTKEMINRLCKLAGGDPMFSDVDAPDRPAGAAIRADQFYGKVQTTAAREYLELRNSTNRGPATPREIFDALSAGGFQFDTKSETNAITGLRATLRKNSSIFHKLPTGHYGLRSWYPNAKATRVDEDDVDQPSARKPGRSVNAKGRTTATATKRTIKAADLSRSTPKTKGVSIEPFILTVVNEGGDWTPKTLKREGLNRGASGFVPTLSGRVVHAALLHLLKQGRVTHVGKGTWRAVSPRSDQGEEPPEAVVHLRSSAA
jgi:hypothetical protein